MKGGKVSGLDGSNEGDIYLDRVGYRASRVRSLVWRQEKGGEWRDFGVICTG